MSVPETPTSRNSHLSNLPPTPSLLSAHITLCVFFTLHWLAQHNCNCNLIYLITCKHCGIHYVGQTKNRLLTRFQGHYHDIKTKNDTTVSRHFNKCPNGKPSLFDGIRISILSFMHHPSDTTSSQRERDIEEKRWMQRFFLYCPEGS